MKRKKTMLPVPPPDDLVDWFRNLYQGTTSHGNQKLYGINRDNGLAIIKVHHPGWHDRMQGWRSGSTEWLVVIIGTDKPGGHGYPQHVWKKDGRLLKADQDEIEKEFGLVVNKGFMP